MRVALTCLAILLISAHVSRVRAAPCDRLSGAKKQLADKLLKSTYAYDCCDETLHRCLQQFKVCKLVKRLRDDICRRVGKGQTEKQIKLAMDRRARSMTPMGKKASFSLDSETLAGDSDAPVTVVVYACARCPFCARVVPDLHRMVTRGKLKGKVKLYFRPFPIRGHPGSVEGGLAFVAAAKMGKFWPYLNLLYAQFKSFSKDKLPRWADKVGLNSINFAQQMADKANRAALVKSKKEGLRNKVTATPTLFINGRKYHGTLDHETLLDVLDEEHDRVKGKRYCKKR
jgi:protein-disulfide isomerase